MFNPYDKNECAPEILLCANCGDITEVTSEEVCQHCQASIAEIPSIDRNKPKERQG